MIGSQYLVFPNTFSPVLTDGMSVRFSHDSGPAQFPVCPLFGNNESRLRGFEPQHLDFDLLLVPGGRWTMFSTTCDVSSRQGHPAGAPTHCRRFHSQINGVEGVRPLTPWTGARGSK